MTAPIDPRRHIHFAAKDFKLASEILQRQFGQGQVFRFPLRSTIVVTALSIELYLKYLIAARTGAPAEGHNLEQLFERLPADLRELLRQSYEGQPQPDPPTLSQALRDYRRVFVDWRYIYERVDEEITINISGLLRLTNALETVAGQVRLGP